ncbi:MAG: efflux RND transporter permease subunit [Thermoguttaceae bacterium]|nr:efflux RND transporter permease subunit [Thermoguttaceae bacterium]MDW8078329.1 efflux RND transporter permease subunit [Thermoguttaceae bacterium]
MWLVDISIRRPVALTCLYIGLVILGIYSYRQMPLELLPKLDVPYITVVTVYPGASPEDLELDVAKRIEDAVLTVEGLKHVSSSCMENVVVTLLEFQLGTDVDRAATDVREKIDLIRRDLPEGVEDPKIEKFDINASPIITLALVGDQTVTVDDLYDYADNTLRDRLTTIEGVAGVQIVGGAKREVRVELDPERLFARGLTTADVMEALRRGLGTIPSGRVQEGGTEFSVTFDADPRTVEALADLEIANFAGRRVYLRDVGSVRMGTEELRQLAWLDGRPAISIRVVKKAEANAVAVTRQVRQRLAEIQKMLPPGMELVWVAEIGRFIEQVNQSAWQDVGMGIVLTAAILFVFLYNLRSLLIVAISMPVTIAVGLFFMRVAGLGLNTSTLIAIGLSVGVLVTNSIVVLEAILMRLARGMNPWEAARIGASEVFIAVLASATTNMVVLFPLATMQTRVGLFIAPLAITMFIMTVVSLFISFTLTPMLASLFLREQRDGRTGLLQRIARLWQGGLERLTEGYRKVLWQLTRPAVALLVVALSIGLLVHAGWVARQLGTSFIATPDMGQVYVKLEFPTSYTLERTAEIVRLAEARMRDLPELRHILSTIGKVEGVLGQASEGVFLAQILVVFSDKDRRSLTIEELMEQIRQRIADLPDAAITVSQPSAIGGQSYPIEMEIAGEDLKTLDRLADRTLALAREIPGILDATTTVRPGKPRLRITPRREILGDLGIPSTAVGLTLRGNLEGIEAGTFKMGARNYDIVVSLKKSEGRDQVWEYQFPGRPGQPLVLTSFASIVQDEVPIQIFRKDKERVQKLTAQLAEGVALGNAAAQLSNAIREKAGFPPGYSFRFTGIFEVMTEGLGGLAEAGVLSLLLVYLCLAAILESFRQPFLVMATVPLALVGTFWALGLTGESLSIFAVMGIVIMIGIVVNNAILIVDRLNIIRQTTATTCTSAMIDAACDRLQAQLMITLAAVMGMLPMAVSRGLGAELRNGVGIASAGGILVSATLTLFVVPALYLLAHCRERRSSAPASSTDSASLEPLPEERQE